MFHRTVAAFAFSIAGGIPAAGAQETPSVQGGPTGQPIQQEGPRPRPEATEEIVVTGSRVKRRDLTTPAPVVIVSREEFLRTGRVSVGDVLQLLPEQANANNRSWNNGGDGTTRVSLRGLGPHRTLVLLNGRRVVAGGNGADVSADVGVLPASAVERIEVLKDGASPIYGSDALGGVVNVITRKTWSGAEASVYSGVSSHGDGETFDASLTMGRSSEAGSLLFSAGYAREATVWAGDRPFSRYFWSDDLTGLNSPLGAVGPYAVGSGNTPVARVFVVGPPGATIPGADLYNQLVTTYPRARSFVRDPAAPLGWRPWAGSALPEYGGDQYNFSPANYLVTPAERLTLFATGDVRVAEPVRAFFEASYATRDSQQKLAPEPFFALNDGIAVSARNRWNPFGVDLPDVNRRLMELGHRTFTQNVDTLRLLGGVDGTLPDAAGPLRGWTWELSYGQGRTRGNVTTSGYTKKSALEAALGPSFEDAEGWHCGTPETGAIPGCVPLNLFADAGAIPADQLAGITYDGTWRGTNATTALLASLGGPLLPLLAERPVAVALGYEYRRVSGTLVPDPLVASGDASTDGALMSTRGSQDAHEAYAELSVPIVDGVRFAESVEALAAARVFRYSGFGTDWTWKLGGRWTPLRDVTLRGTWSTAFRAPAIWELYFGTSRNYYEFDDPCSGFDAQGWSQPVSPWCGDAANNGSVRVATAFDGQGNPDLRPEVAHVATAGIVVEPRFLRGLSLTLDLYDVRIRDAINRPNGLQIEACYPMSPDVRPQLCEYVERDPVTHELTRVLDVPVNIGTERMRGLDAALRYQLPTRAGRFGLSLDATWLDRYDIVRADGSVLRVKGTYDYPTLAALFPTWKYNAGLTWGWRGLGAGVSVRYVGPFKECGDASGMLPGTFCSFDHAFERRVRANDTWDAFASWALASGAGKTEVSVGVQNLFDTPPPRIFWSWFPSDPGYDFVGRFFYARLAHRL